MDSIRYYAIGHSYLKHGPFVGWQTEGFWGMAASAPEKDYFHKIQEGLQQRFSCKLEALAENHAGYERICTVDATRESYTASEAYGRMREVLREFKPNFITLFIGGGNTVAKDEASLRLFFEVLYGLIAEEKPKEAVVAAVSINEKIHRISAPVAQSFGLCPVDASFIHQVSGRENPFYAFAQYPAYDEKAAAGAVEFRTHPNDAGHAAIAEAVLGVVGDALAELPAGEPSYSYQRFLQREVPARLHIATEPAMRVSYFGFNVCQKGEAVTFGSAPNTGASLVADGFSLDAPKACLEAEVAVEGAREGEYLRLRLCGDKGEKELALPLEEQCKRYHFVCSEDLGTLRSLRLAPDSKECVVSIRELKLFSQSKGE